MFLWSYARKPEASTRIAYVPGGSDTNSYAPVSLDVAERCTACSTFVSVTVAPVMLAPVLSKIVPRSDVVPCCPKLATTTNVAKIEKRKLNRRPILWKLHLLFELRRHTYPKSNR